MKKKSNMIWVLALIFINFSCKKLISIDPPPTQLTTGNVFTNSSSVTAAASNLYTVLGTVDANFITSNGTYTDELITSNVDATSVEFTNGVLTSVNSRVLSIWQNLYSTIYKCNSLIEGLQGSVAIPDSLKNQCLGEAFFLRAYAHFMLTNIYGDVPLIITTNVNANASAGRVSSNLVYQQVITDLKNAITLLPASYTGDGEKIRANKWAATALLAKVYLYNSDYNDAENQATAVISSGQYTLLSNLNSVFLANSSEAILQLWNANGYTTINSVPASGKPAFQASSSLLNSFEAGDQRLADWIKSTVVSGTTYHYPYKYKARSATSGTNAEYTMYLRLADVYLIRAEARGQQNELATATSDLNIIRSRAGLNNTTANTQSSLLSAIYQERRVEMFNEGGNRFFDLKRSGMINTVLSPIKPLWKSAGALYSIPHSEILTDPNLTQNPGYNN